MADLLLVTNAPLGMRYATIELGRRLRAANHRVTFFGQNEDRDLANHHGLAFRALPADRTRDFHRQDSAVSRWVRMRDLPARRREALHASGVDWYARAVRDHRPDLILLDGEMQEHILWTSASCLPVALLNTFVSIWRQPGVPPPHTAIQPGVGWQGGAAGISLAWSAFLLRKRVNRWLLKWQQAGCDRTSVLHARARELDFDLAGATDTSQWLIPFTWPRLPTLSLHAREFELHPRPPESVRYLGPMVLADRLDRSLPAADRQRLDAIFDRCRNRTLIYAGFGSFFTAHPRWLRRLFAAIKRRRDWELILSLGGQADSVELPASSDRIHAFAWVPQLEVLSHADVAVIHGGINSIDECVLAGVPMLVCPGRETDMGGSTARLAHHGLGLIADPGRDSAQQIAACLDRLLQDHRFEERLRVLGEAYGAYADQEVAERTVDELLTGIRSSAVESSDSKTQPRSG